MFPTIQQNTSAISLLGSFIDVCGKKLDNCHGVLERCDVLIERKPSLCHSAYGAPIAGRRNWTKLAPTRPRSPDPRSAAVNRKKVKPCVTHQDSEVYSVPCGHHEEALPANGGRSKGDSCHKDQQASQLYVQALPAEFVGKYLQAGGAKRVAQPFLTGHEG